MHRVLFFALVLQFIHAAPPSDETLKIIAENYLAKKPVPMLEKGFSMEEALKTQTAFVDLLSKELGPVAGYKIGLITKVSQERMGASGPVRAVLLKKMLLKNKATVLTNFGVRPALELDLGVIVKDEGINDAKTVAEVAEHLS